MQGMKISGCIIHFSIIGIFDLLRNKGYLENIISIYYTTVNIIGEANFSFNSNARNIICFMNVLSYCTVGNFHRSNFRGLGSSDDFMG